MKKTCIDCGREKKIESFTRNKNMKDGYLSLCKICNNERHKKYRQKYSQQKENEGRNPFALTGVTKRDWCNTYKLLKDIGYDIEKDIHQQFIDKHGITKYKKRPLRNIRSYSAQDCLDIFDETDSLSNQ